MTRFGRLFLAAAVLATVAVGLATAARGEDAVPPAPQRWVTDGAGFLSPNVRGSLDTRLQEYEQRTGHQVLVWITQTAGNFTPEDFASKAFATWRVGRANIDDGVVLFVFADDRKLRFEVGYGLESTVTDAVAGKILRETIVPRIQAGDRDGAIVEGIAALTAVLDGTASPGAEAAPNAASDDSRPSGGHQLSTGEKIVIGLLVIGFIILLITNPSLALWLLFNLLAGGRGGGGGGGGGGGFSGGGGRSGGGGASGSW